MAHKYSVSAPTGRATTRFSDACSDYCLDVAVRLTGDLLAIETIHLEPDATPIEGDPDELLKE